MRQVLVREKQLNGNNTLMQADVISEDRGLLRVVINGRKGVIEVEAKNTLPVAALFGSPVTNPNRTQVLVPKQYPPLGTLGHTLNQ